MTPEELQAKLDGLRAKRRELNFEISLVTADIQRLCQHEWKWHQVAGEGRYCPLCGAVDYSED